MKNRILITGASGLIGSHLLEQLNEEIFDIYILGRTSPTWSKKVNFINADFSKDWELEILPSKMDVIIHLAQSENFREFPEKAGEVFYVNTLSSLKLADYANRAGVKHFIYASSAGIYGSGGDGFNEEQEIIYKNELGFYLATKHCSEVLLENYELQFNVIILRFFFVYGKNQRKSMLIPRLVGFVRNGEPILLQGKEGIKINPTHVSDAVNAIMKSLNLEGSHKINVAGPEILTLKDIGLKIGKKLNKKPIFKEDNNAVPNNIIGTIDKMCRLLEPPSVFFAHGVESVIEE